MPPAMGIDSIPFAHRGYDCLTFSSGSLGKTTFAIHSPVTSPTTSTTTLCMQGSAQLAAAVALTVAGQSGELVGR